MFIKVGFLGEWHSLLVAVVAISSFLSGIRGPRMLQTLEIIVLKTNLKGEFWPGQRLNKTRKEPS